MSVFPGDGGAPVGYLDGMRKHTPLADRFWRHVNKDGPVHPVLGTACWVWTGKSVDRHGYGFMRAHEVHRYPVRVHRVVHLIVSGEMPAPDQMVCHHCDNPPCVRPDHHFFGVSVDNQSDAGDKERMPWGEGHFNHILTVDEVREGRRAVLAGEATTAMLAGRFGVAVPTMQEALVGRTWRHVDGPLVPLETILTSADVAAMRTAAHSGESRESIAQRFGLSREYTRRVLRGNMGPPCDVPPFRLHAPRLTADDLTRIRYLVIVEKRTRQDVATAMGISPLTVKKILTGGHRRTEGAWP